MSITSIDDFAVMILREPFGGAVCPFSFTDIVSEPATDLGNDLLASDWDNSKICSPHIEKLDPPALLDPSIPFGKALSVDAVVPPSSHGKMDDFIDDIITAGCADSNWKRLAGASLLSSHLLDRPILPNEPVKRDDLVALNKLKAEGTLNEVQTVLGWRIDARRFAVALPKEKFAAWMKSLEEIISKGSCTLKELNTLLGRLNHAAMVIPMSRHFLGRSRHVLCMKYKNNQVMQLSSEILEDLALWLKSLRKAHSGISVNLLVERYPSQTHIADSYENGIGGFSLITGKAWRFELPNCLKGRVSNDALECLAEIVGTWMGVIDKEVAAGDCVFSCTDNATAVGWSRRTNFTVSDSAELQFSRKLASLILDADCCLHAQHIRGIHNWVADSLSRDFHIPDLILSNLLACCFPNQGPTTLEICPLPSVIASFIIGILDACPVKNQSPLLPTPSTIGAGLAGWDFSKSWDLGTTRAWIRSPQGKECFSHARSLVPSGMVPLADHLATVWQNARLKRPWAKWLRASGQTFGATPAMTRMGTKIPC